MKQSDEFLEIVREFFRLNDDMFNFDMNSRNPNYDFPDLKRWETKIVTDLFDSIYYEIDHGVLILNLRVIDYQKQHFDNSWNKLTETVKKEFQEYEITIENQYSCIRNTNRYLLVKKETEENTILSITIGRK